MSRSGSYLRTNVRQTITILAATGLLLASFAGVAAASTPNTISTTSRVTISGGFVRPPFGCYLLPRPVALMPCRI